MQHAIVHMQPLNVRREPMYPAKFVGTVPRDAEPHRISGAWPLNREKEMPHYVRVWADNRSKDFEVDCAAPERLRFLDGITFYQDLTVLPRH